MNYCLDAFDAFDAFDAYLIELMSTRNIGNSASVN